MTGTQVFDALIVGAGLSGLAAASRLAAELPPSARLLVVEARSRVGGRTLTAPAQVPGAAVADAADLGGQWVGPGQTNVLALAKQLGLELIQQQFLGESGGNAAAADSSGVGGPQLSSGASSPLAPADEAELAAVVRQLDSWQADVRDVGGWAASERAQQWSLQSVAAWLAANVRSEAVRREITLAVQTVGASRAAARVPWRPVAAQPQLSCSAAMHAAGTAAACRSGCLPCAPRAPTPMRGPQVLAVEPWQLSFLHFLSFLGACGGLEAVGDGHGGAQVGASTPFRAPGAERPGPLLARQAWHAGTAAVSGRGTPGLGGQGWRCAARRCTVPWPLRRRGGCAAARSSSRSGSRSGLHGQTRTPAPRLVRTLSWRWGAASPGLSALLAARRCAARWPPRAAPGLARVNRRRHTRSWRRAQSSWRCECRGRADQLCQLGSRGRSCGEHGAPRTAVGTAARASGAVAAAVSEEIP
jgi:hypothetical protein